MSEDTEEKMSIGDKIFIIIILASILVNIAFVVIKLFPRNPESIFRASGLDCITSLSGENCFITKLDRQAEEIDTLQKKNDALLDYLNIHLETVEAQGSHYEIKKGKQPAVDIIFNVQSSWESTQN